MEATIHRRQRRGVLRQELRDFLHFVCRPTFGPRLPRRPMHALAADWVGCLNWRRIVRWVLLLWAVNFLVLGPLAAAAALAGGASHRFNAMVLPWFLALVWAPIMEELMFRLGLRRPGAALWLIPAFALVVFYGRDVYVGIFLVVSLALVAMPRPQPRAASSEDSRAGMLVSRQPGADWQPLLPGVRFNMRWNRRYRRAFPLVFHVASITFAVLHLLNFSLTNVPWWLLPFLVLPQWVTGLVLGWLRVRTGIGASIAAHSLFNAGPLAVVWLLMQAGLQA